MSMHLARDLEAMRKKLSMLGALVEESTAKAIEFIRHPDPRLDEEIGELEARVNEVEVEIEEDCLKVLALHQPVAADLRFIIAVLKVNNDLERMGDQSQNIVNRVRSLQSETPLADVPDFAPMSVKVLNMVRVALDALIKQDVELARQVVLLDDEVDDIHAENYQFLRHQAALSPETVGAAMSYGTISSNLERIGDLSTNIAEDVIFMMEGHVVRHKAKA